MEKKIKIIAVISVLLLLACGGLAFAFIKTKEQRDSARLSTGLGLLFRAEVQDQHYPETLLYAAKSIGFKGYGISKDKENKEIVLIRKKQNSDHHAVAEEWISSRSAYRPVWTISRNAPVTDLAAGPKGRYLLVAGKDSVLQWDLSKQGSDTLIEKGGGSVAFHPLGNRFAAIDDGAVSVQEDNKEIGRFEESITSLAYSLSGNLLAAAREDGTIVLLEGEKSVPLGKTIGQVSHLAFGPNDATLAAVIPGKGLRLWFHHDKTAHESWTEHEGDVTAVAYHPDPQSGNLVIGKGDGSLELWRIFDGKPIGSVPPANHHDGQVTSLSFRSDGKRLVSGGEDGLVYLWDTENATPEFLAALSGHSARVNDVEFLAGGEMVASCDEDGVVKIWYVSEGAKTNDLYSLVKQGWYTFDKASGELTLGEGDGIVNLPPGSLIGLWQSGKQFEAAAWLIESGNIVGASLLGADAGPIRTALGDSIDEAQRSGNLQLAMLRSRQMELLGLETKAIDTDLEEGKNFTNGEGAEMIWCKPGDFFMGESDGPDFAKKHKVTFSSGFWLAKHEVTQEIYQSVMGDNPSQRQNAEARLPAENFNWHQAAEFCQKLTALERYRGRIPAGWRYAIPTEAQWEYACRAGTQTVWSFGDDESQLHAHANFDDEKGEFSEDSDPSQNDGHKYAAPVGSYQANPWGFHDMHGNVFEWCRDAMDPSNPNYPEGAATDPEVTQGNLRIIRGGGFDGTAAECRSAYRDANQPVVPSDNLGLRIALVRE